MSIGSTDYLAVFAAVLKRLLHNKTQPLSPTFVSFCHRNNHFSHSLELMHLIFIGYCSASHPIRIAVSWLEGDFYFVHECFQAPQMVPACTGYSISVCEITTVT